MTVFCFNPFNCQNKCIFDEVVPNVPYKHKKGKGSDYLYNNFSVQGLQHIFRETENQGGIPQLPRDPPLGPAPLFRKT